jgi:dephospho-CoA kinase
MIKIAITGGIACGKSLTGEIIKAFGIPVCETDLIGHQLLDQNESIKSRLVKEFGTVIVNARGGVDRSVLGQIVFNDAEKRAKLNELTHPAILKEVDEWLGRQAATSTCAIAIIPLLYEIGAENAWDKVICVGSPESQQIQRLMERGFSTDEAMARINSQMSLAEKMERADYVIFNCGSKSLLEKQVKQVLRGIRGEK